MDGYNVIIKESSKDLSVKERISIKDTSNCESIDTLTNAQGKLIIDYAYHVVLGIHNEKSDNPDYIKVIVVDKSGAKYMTGSAAFLSSLTEIVEEMTAAGEADDIKLECYRKESKNYKGKTFITVSLI